MKIAITATDNNLSAKADKRFGRCSYFTIVTMDKNMVEFVRNPHKESEEGAGPASVQFIANLGVQKVVSGEFGGKASDLLRELGIEMHAFGNESYSIADLLEKIK